MSWLALALGAVLQSCTPQAVTVTAQDMYGRDVKYQARYWLCPAGARPPEPWAMPVCREDGNPYRKEIWAAPWFAQDLRWLCGE